MKKEQSEKEYVQETRERGDGKAIHATLQCEGAEKRHACWARW